MRLCRQEKLGDLMITLLYVSYRPAQTLDALLTAFKFYSFRTDIPILTSISSFAVAVVSTSGGNRVYDNNGKWFPISDRVIVQTPRSCVSNGRLYVLAAASCALEKIPVPSLLTSI